MLDQKLAEAMQRVLSKGEDRLALTGALQRLVDEGIGTKRGKSVYFNDRDRDDIRKWLEAKGYALERCDLSGLSRSERLAVTPNEKAGREAIKRNRVSIKALSGKQLRVGGEVLSLPTGSHLDVDWTKIADQVDHNSILVVENYENFNCIQETTFVLPERFASPLVVYRGDPGESRLDAVQGFLEHLQLPVLAFVDADPAGVGIALQLPNLVGMVLPPLDVLADQLQSPRTGRRDLFYEQYPGHGQLLEKLSAENPCYPVWELLKLHKSGVVQERWIGASCTLIPSEN